MHYPWKNQQIRVPMNTDGVTERVFDGKQAQTCLDENRYEEAVKMAEARLAESPGDVEALIILCQGFLRLGKLDRLQILLQEVDERILRLSQVYLRLGELCGKSGLNAESLNFFHKYNTLAAGISPKENGYLPEEPLAISEDDDASEDETTDISSEFYTMTLADLYIRQGHPAQARDVLQSIMANEPENEQVLAKLAELDKLMTISDVNEVFAAVDAGAIDINAAIVSELEGWLARLGRLRSPAA
jgi:predicted Zn-dependent protease